VHTQEERVFIHRHYFTLKLFAAVLEAFRIAYPDEEVPSKTVLQQLVTKYGIDAYLQEGDGHFQHLLQQAVL
jgi:hypothetical protein